MTTDTTPRPTKPSTDLITVLLGAWLMIGLFLDGYAHTNIIEELESFFTPWHAVFYSGFIATALWVLWTVAKRRVESGSLRAAIPPGYGLAVIGTFVFAAGGIGDGIWHTVYGIEAGVDALLSPTHLLLFVGIVLIMTTPIRSAYRRSTGERLGGLDRSSIILTATLTTAILAFIFTYLWAPGRPWLAEQPFNPATGDGELFIALGMGAIMVSNLILLGPLTVILGRWRPPLGMATISWTLVNATTAAAFDLDVPLAVAVGLAGGLVADIVILATSASPSRQLGTILTLTLSPIAAWSVYFFGVGMFGDLQWPPEIWGGAIIFTALTGLGLSTLGQPRKSPEPKEDMVGATSAVR